MQEITKFEYTHQRKTQVMTFGHPETEEEFQDMFDLRYRVYVGRGYIDETRFANDQDEYDEAERSVHFIAKLNNGRVVGAARLIVTDPLPTEDIYEFTHAFSQEELPSSQKGELSRLVVLPFQERKKSEGVPRGMIMAFLLYSVILYAREHNLVSGLSFVKKKLKQKLEAMKAPVSFPEVEKVDYPDNGILYPYFHQKDDPVSPVFFQTDVFQKYFEKTFGKKLFFKKVSPQHFVLRDNLAVSIARFFRFL